LYIMNRHFSNRGVSQVIAALLLIAIAVAAAILLYVFAIGLLGSLGSSGGQQTKQQLIMEAYNWDSSSDTIVLTLRNVGSSSIDAGATDVFVNGVQQLNGLGGACAGKTLTPGESCGASFTAPAGASSYVPGAAYPLKLVTPDGGVFSYSIIDGGSS
jgi:flagellin-like protein